MRPRVTCPVTRDAAVESMTTTETTLYNVASPAAGVVSSYVSLNMFIRHPGDQEHGYSVGVRNVTPTIRFSSAFVLFLLQMMK